MAGYSRQRTHEVLLEVDLDAEPIEGQLTTGGRPASGFIGWIGLVSALDALRAAAPPEQNERRTTT